MKYSGVIICICFVLFSCNKPITKNDNNNGTKNDSINVTSYTGNAIVFLQEDYTENYSVPHVKFFFVNNVDSTVFKQNQFDVRKYISGKLCISIALNYKLNFFLKSKYKHKVDFKVCNISPAYKYYIKCWISYSGYEESPKYHNRKLNSQDTCYQTAIIYDNFSKKGSSGKQIEYRILSSP